MLWWMGSRWTWVFGIQQDKKTTTDSAHFPTHRRYNNHNKNIIRQCCATVHVLSSMHKPESDFWEWMRKLKGKKKKQKETRTPLWTQDSPPSLPVFLTGSDCYRLWLLCFPCLTRMCFLSAFRLWVLPRLKTSVPRWVIAVCQNEWRLERCQLIYVSSVQFVLL